MSSVIQVNSITNAFGNNFLVNGYPRQPGQIIEYLSSPCDGSVMTGASGSYPTTNVTTQQATTDIYADITGSTLLYTPPAGTSRVLYRFNFGVYSVTTHDILDFKFFIDANEVLYARHNRSAQYLEFKSTFEWCISIGGTDNTNTGRLATWTTSKTLKMQVRRYGAANYGNLHGTRYWDGVVGTALVQPEISIIAIA